MQLFATVMRVIFRTRMGGLIVKNLKMVIMITLIVSFLIISLLSAIIGVVGIMGMRQVNGAIYNMYEFQLAPVTELGIASEMLQRQRVEMREMIIGAAADDPDMIENARARADIYHEIMQEALYEYSITIRSAQAMQIFEEARFLYDTEFRVGLLRIYEGTKYGVDAEDLYMIMREFTPAVNQITDNFDTCLAMKTNVAQDTMYSADNMSDMLTIIIIVLIVLMLIVTVGVTVFLAIYTSVSIKKYTGNAPCDA